MTKKKDQKICENVQKFYHGKLKKK
jgi:hypothetical protein